MRALKPPLTGIILFLISFILRIMLISKGPFSVDCLQLALKAEHTLQTGQLGYLLGSGYPFVILLGSFFVLIVKLLGITDPVFAVNLMSVVFGSLCVFIFYLLARKLFDQTTAILAALLFSVNPILLSISVYGTSHTPSLFFILAGFLALWHYRKENKIGLLILSAFCFGLTGACRLQELFLITPAIAYLFCINLNADETCIFQKQPIRKIILFMSLTVLTACIFYLPYLLGSENKHYLSQLTDYRELSVASGFLPENLMGLLADLIKALTAGGLLLALIGFIAMYQEHKKIFWFCMLWILQGMALNCFLHTFAPRFNIVYLPVLFLSLGYILSFALKINTLYGTVSFFAFFVIFNLLLLSVISPLTFRHQYALIPEYVRWVEQVTEPQARIITSDDSLFYRTYSDRQLLGKPVDYFHIDDKQLLDFHKEIDDLLNQNIPVYINYLGLYEYDPHDQFSDFLKNNYTLKWIGQHPYEDWHHGGMYQRTYLLPLLKIENK